MKKLSALVLTFALAGLPGAFARADKPYGIAGCGLGNVIFGKRDNQVLASTTNHSTYTQMFAISSGTSNCVDNGVVRKDKEVTMYIEANHTRLAADISRGSGETVSGLAHLLNCRDSAAFGAELQKSYQVIFPGGDVDSARVEDTLRALIRENAALSGLCRIG